MYRTIASRVNPFRTGTNSYTDYVVHRILCIVGLWRKFYILTDYVHFASNVHQKSRVRVRDYPKQELICNNLNHLSDLAQAVTGYKALDKVIAGSVMVLDITL